MDYKDYARRVNGVLKNTKKETPESKPASETPAKKGKIGSMFSAAASIAKNKRKGVGSTAGKAYTMPASKPEAVAYKPFQYKPTEKPKGFTGKYDAQFNTDNSTRNEYQFSDLYERLDTGSGPISSQEWMQLAFNSTQNRAGVNYYQMMDTDKPEETIESGGKGILSAIGSTIAGNNTNPMMEYNAQQQARIKSYVQNFTASNPSSEEYDEVIDYIQAEIEQANESGESNYGKYMEELLDYVLDSGVENKNVRAITMKRDRAQETYDAAIADANGRVSGDMMARYSEIENILFNNDGSIQGDELNALLYEKQQINKAIGSGEDTYTLDALQFNPKASRAKDEIDRYSGMLETEEQYNTYMSGNDDPEIMQTVEEYVNSIPEYNVESLGTGVVGDYGERKTRATNAQIVMDPAGVIDKTDQARRVEGTDWIDDDLTNNNILMAEQALFMTDDERTTYFKIAATQGDDAAEEYFSFLADRTLNERRAKALDYLVEQNYLDDSTAEKIAKNVLTIPSKLIGQIMTGIGAIGGGKFSAYNPINDALRVTNDERGLTRNELYTFDQKLLNDPKLPQAVRDTISFLTNGQGLFTGMYDVGTNVADNLFRGLMTGGLLEMGVPESVFSLVNNGVMGLTSFAESCYTNYEKFESGEWTYDEYMMHNICDGLNEIIQETCFGKFEWNAELGNVKSYKDALKYIGKTGMDEGLEEFLGGELDVVFDKMISGITGGETELDAAKKDYMENGGYSEAEATVMAVMEYMVCNPVAAGGSGALSGIFMAGGSSFRQAMHESMLNRQTGEQIAANGPAALNQVMTAAMESSDESVKRGAEAYAKRLEDAGIQWRGATAEAVGEYNRQEAERAEQEQQARQTETETSEEEAPAEEAAQAEDAAQTEEAAQAEEVTGETVEIDRKSEIRDRMNAINDEINAIMYGDNTLRSGSKITERTLSAEEQQQLDQLKEERKQLSEELQDIVNGRAPATRTETRAAETTAETEAETQPAEADAQPAETEAQQEETETEETPEDDESPRAPMDSARVASDELTASERALDETSAAYEQGMKDLDRLERQLEEMERTAAERGSEISMDADGNYNAEDIAQAASTGDDIRALKDDIASLREKNERLKENMYLARDAHIEARKKAGAEEIARVDEQRAAERAEATEETTTESAEDTQEETTTEDEKDGENEKPNAPVDIATVQKKMSEFFKSKKNLTQLGEIYNRALEALGAHIYSSDGEEAERKVREALGEENTKSDVIVEALTRTALGTASEEDMEMLYADAIRDVQNGNGNMLTVVVENLIGIQNSGVNTGRFTRYGEGSDYSEGAQQRMKMYQDLFAAASNRYNAVISKRDGNGAKAGKGQVTVHSDNGDVVTEPTGKFKAGSDGLMAEVKNSANGDVFYNNISNLAGVSNEQAGTLNTIRTFAGTDANAAEVMWNGYKATGYSVNFGDTIGKAYQYGRAGMTEDAAMRAIAPNKASQEAVKKAFEIGSKTVKARNERAKNTAKDKGGRYTASVDGKTYDLTSEKDFERFANDHDLNANQKAALNVFGKFVGTKAVNVELFRSEANDNGVITDVNGSYNNETNTIRIDINAGMDISGQDFMKRAMARVFSHELTHYIQANNAEGYAKLTSAVISALDKNGYNFTGLVNRQLQFIDTKDKTEQDIYDEAVDEVVANACEMMLKDSAVAEEIANEVGREDRSLGQMILDFIRSFLDDLKKAFAGVTANSREARLLSNNEEAFKNVQKIWDEALKTAMEKAAGEMVTTETGAVVSPEVAAIMESDDYAVPDNGVIRESVRTTDEWIAAHMKNYPNDKAFRQNAELIEHLDRMVVQDSVLRMLVPHGKTTKTKYGPIRDNIEYRYTFDMDTKCERTYQFLAYRNAIQNKIGRQLTENEARSLIELMRAYGQMIPCTYCYVEGKRMVLADQYLKYIKKTNGGEIGGVKRSAEEIFDLVEAARTITENYLDSIYNKDENYSVDEKHANGDFAGYRDFNMPVTEEAAADEVCKRYGITNKSARKIIEGYVSEWAYNRKMDLPLNLINADADFETDSIDEDVLAFHDRATKAAQGAAKARGIDNYEAYVDQLKNISDEDFAYINGMGGIRKHSSNDFQIQNLQDYMMFFMDLAADKRGGKGWMGHTYTKNLDYARIFAPTNDRINCSIAMYGDNTTGIRMNEQEGVNWEELKKVRAKYKNVGAMAMVTNNDQLSFALNEDWIDMIIPFHASGMKRSLYRDVLAWTDYTSKQGERLYNKAKKIEMLQERGVSVKKSAKAAEVNALFAQTFGDEIKIVYKENGKQFAPHFFPGETVQHGNVIPGHGNNAQRYFELCREYGCNPRFYGLKVQDKNGDTIDITEHEGYLKLIKETARTDSEQEEIVAKFDMEYAEKAMKGFKGYDNLKDDSYGIVDEFVREYVGKNRKVGWLTERAEEYRDAVREMQEEAKAKREAAKQKLQKSIDENARSAQHGQVRNSIRETTDGRKVVIVDDDILKNIDLSTWDKETVNLVRKAAKQALKKHSNVPVMVNEIPHKINKTTRKEYVSSRYTGYILNNEKDVFLDKARVSDNYGEILTATVGWENDGELKHDRKDDFVDFRKGDVFFMSGNNKYKARTVVGINSKGEHVAYDLTDIEPAIFELQKISTDTPANEDLPLRRINTVDTEDIITDNSENSNAEFAQNEGKSEINPQKTNDSDNAAESFIRSSQRTGELTDRDLLQMAHDAVAQTETEKEYMKMYRQTVEDIRLKFEGIEAERKHIENAMAKGMTDAVTKGRNRLTMMQRQLDEAVEKASKLEASQPLRLVMHRIRHETEQAVLEAMTQMRDAAVNETGEVSDADMEAALKKQARAYQLEIVKLKDKIKMEQAKNAELKNGPDQSKRRGRAPDTKKLIDNYEKRIRQLETRIASMDNGSAKALAKEVQKREKAIENLKDRRKASETRRKIRAIIDNFNQRLAHPRAGKYIPVDMVRGIIQALESFDLSYVRNGEEVVSKSIREMYEKYQQYKDDGQYNPYYNEVIAARLEQLAKDMGDTKFRNMKAEQLEKVYEHMKSLHHVVTEAVKLKTMEGYEDAIEAGDIAIRQVRDAAPMVKGKAGEILNWMSSPDNFFKRISGFAKNAVLSQMQRQFVNGEQKMLEIQREYVNQFAEYTSGEDFKKLSAHKEADLVDVGLKNMETNEEGGHDPILITRGMMLSLYMHMMCDDNIRGIARGGLTIPNITRYYEKNPAAAFNDAKAYRTSGIQQRTEGLLEHYKASGMNDDQARIEAAKDRSAMEDEEVKNLQQIRDKIWDMLTEDEKGMIAAAHKWFDVKSRNYINEVSMDLYGFKVAGVQNYFPIHRDANFLNKQFESVANDASLANMGFLKERVKASQPIMLMDFAYEIASSVDTTSRYVGFARAERDFNLLYKAQLPGMTTSLREQIGKKFHSGDPRVGVTGMQYIDNYVNDIIGNNRSKATIWDDIRSNLARSTLTLNPRVALSQAASIPTAVAELDLQSIMTALKDFKVLKPSELNKLAQDDIWFWQRYRGEGGMTEFSDARKNGTKLDRIYNDIADSKVGKKLMNWCQDFDVGSTAIIHKATEYWVTRHTGYTQGSDMWKQAVADKYRDVLRRTQPMYMTTARSDVMRSSDAIMKTFTMFKTQASQNLNTLYNAVAEYRKFKADLNNGENGVTSEDVREAESRLKHSIAGVGMGAIAYAVFRFLANALMGKLKKYKDDETDELTLGSTMKGITVEAISSLSSMMVFGDNLYSIAESVITGKRYYGISETAVGQIGEMAESIVEMSQSVGTDKFGKKAAGFFSSLAGVLGLPMDNVMNVANAATFYVNGMTHGALDADTTDNQMYNRMIGYLMDGNTQDYETALAEEMQKSGKTLKEAQAGLKNRVLYWYENGAMKREEVEKILTGDQIGLDADTVFWALDKSDYTIKHGGKSDGYDRTLRLQDAIMSGNDSEIQEAINWYKGNGYRTKDFSIVKAAVKALYTEDAISWEQASDLLVKYAGYTKTDKKLGTVVNEDDLFWTQEEWNYAKSGEATLSEGSWNKYADLDRALNDMNVNSAVEHVAYLMSHGVQKSSIASHLASAFKGTYLEMLDVDPVAAEKYLEQYILPVYKAAGYSEAQERKYIAKHWL